MNRLSNQFVVQGIVTSPADAEEGYRKKGVVGEWGPPPPRCCTYQSPRTEESTQKNPRFSRQKVTNNDKENGGLNLERVIFGFLQSRLPSPSPSRSDSKENYEEEEDSCKDDHIFTSSDDDNE